MKFVFCCVVASLLLIGCSDSDDDNDLIPAGDIANEGVNENLPTDLPANTPVDVPANIPSEEYIDSTISLRYPSSWLVNPNGPTAGVNAQFFAPQENATGGNDNCGFVYEFDPSLTLLDTYDQVLELFDSAPEPQQEFLEVNGVPAGKISGVVTVGGFQIPAIAQIMALNGQQVFGICVGSSDEAFDLILDSVNFI